MKYDSKGWVCTLQNFLLEGNVNCTKFPIKETDFDKIFENCEAKSVYSSQIQSFDTEQIIL